MKEMIKLDDVYESYKDFDFERYDIQIDSAISYAEIVALAKTIVKSTQFNKEGQFVQNTCKLNYLSDVIFLATYSNIIIDKNDALPEYDKLTQVFWERSILDDISRDLSYMIFKNTINDIMNDYRQNQINDMNVLLTSVNSSIAFLLGGVSKFLGESTEVVKGLDEKKIVEFMGEMKKKENQKN